MSILNRPRAGIVFVHRLVAALLILPIASAVFAAAHYNGFDLGNSSVPADQIHHGGPPRDGIPAIDDPKFLPAESAAFLAPDDRIMGVVRNGVAKAYPVRILNYHEIVNDRFEDEAIVVTYCPLCGTGMVFSANIGGRDTSFGVSGLLYNSDVLLYDRSTESLWSQIMGEAISGERAGTQLEHLPASHTTWRDWSGRHPDSLVLSTDTGYTRDYSRNPYPGYEDSERIWFPVASLNQRFHPKELVIGVEIDGETKAYPFVELARRQSPFVDRIGSRKLTVEFDAANRTGRIMDEQGIEIPTVIAFWFAWTAFHPDTKVFQSS